MIYVRDKGASMIDTDIDTIQLSARTLLLLPIHRSLVAIGGMVPSSAMENQVYSQRLSSMFSSQVCPSFPAPWFGFSQSFTVKVKALYPYAAGGSDEVPFSEGDELTIIDKSEEEWWKVEQGGMVFIVPAAYLETVEG